MYCKFCILYYNVKKNVDKELFLCDISWIIVKISICSIEFGKCYEYIVIRSVM